MEYGKIVDGNLVKMTLPLVYNGMRHYNPSKETILEAGWKPIHEEGKQYGRGAYCTEEELVIQSADSITLTYKYNFDVSKGRSMLKEILNDRFKTRLRSNIIETSLGFRVDARPDDITNIEGAICLLAKASDTDTFRDADNQFQTVTKTNLKTIKKEILESIAKIRQNKWDTEKKIADVSDLDGYDKFEITL